MDEAFEAGLRLALEDGAAAGMAALAGDLRAVRAGLAALGEIGSREPVGRVPAAVVTMPAPRAEARAAAAEPMVSVAPGVARVETRTVVERVLAAAAPVEAGPAVPVREVRAAPVSVPAVRPVAPEMAPVAGRSGAVPEMAERPAMAVMAPVVLPVQRFVPRPAAMPVERRAMAPVRGEKVSPPWRAAAETGVPVAPAAGFLPPAAPPVPPVPPAPREERAAQPVGGDVYLDGQLLGRWVMDALGREAGRPQGGAAGFDGRLSPAWPGVLQGG